MFAEDCLRGPSNRWLPHMTLIRPLRRDGYVVVMERLWPADEDPAAAFCAALAIGNDSGYVLEPRKPFEDADDADLAALRPRLTAMLADGARRFKLWGGSDIRSGNVMVDVRGQLKLVDPLFVRGHAIIEALQTGRRELLSDFSRLQLEDFLTIPPFAPGAGTDELRLRLERLYGDEDA
jgi:hypothetical protein